MKYIRTKDGEIFEKSKVFIVKENDIEIVMSGIDKEFIERTRGKTWNCGTNEIVKQANTIEELFDVYIVVANGFPFQFPNKPTEILFEKLAERNLFAERVYGAIWIKLPNDAYRLEPVAEMNKDEVWKLL